MNNKRGQTVLELRGIRQSFKQASGQLDVIVSADLEIHAGEMVALIGPSGSGKSTLLHIAGLLEKAAGGEILIDGTPTGGMSDDERTKVRRGKMGFVYQYHHLLPEFSALENVVLPQMIAGQTRRAAAPRAAALLKQVGLGERLDHRPAKLSGGEQQRVAIARALANSPALILADEPTGNLDMHTADDVFDLLMSLVRDTGVAAMIATHNLELAKKMDRVITIREGVLQPY
ncbi:MAG TPA: ABC transporter ATP-binding protein [Dongiaceae bacterium]|nr:ABC transporter ATP-binding protein [Dongiaceae bacterium]